MLSIIIIWPAWTLLGWLHHVTLGLVKRFGLKTNVTFLVQNIGI